VQFGAGLREAASLGSFAAQVVSDEARASQSQIGNSVANLGFYAYSVLR
jgi:hypothetical protein